MHVLLVIAALLYLVNECFCMQKYQGYYTQNPIRYQKILRLKRILKNTDKEKHAKEDKDKHEKNTTENEAIDKTELIHTNEDDDSAIEPFLDGKRLNLTIYKGSSVCVNLHKQCFLDCKDKRDLCEDWRNGRLDYS